MSTPTFDLFEEGLTTPPPKPKKKDKKVREAVLTQNEMEESLSQIEETIEEDVLEIETQQDLLRNSSLIASNRNNQLVTIGENHPLQNFGEIIRELEDVIEEARNANQVAPDAEWLRVTTNALKEIRMNVQQVLPQWNEYQNQQREVSENWLNSLMVFNTNFIVENYGEEDLERYLASWEEFVKNEDVNIPTDN